jgi:hypothetical protein
MDLDRLFRTVTKKATGMKGAIGYFFQVSKKECNRRWGFGENWVTHSLFITDQQKDAFHVKKACFLGGDKLLSMDQVANHRLSGGGLRKGG